MRRKKKKKRRSLKRRLDPCDDDGSNVPRLQDRRFLVEAADPRMGMEIDD